MLWRDVSQMEELAESCCGALVKVHVLEWLDLTPAYVMWNARLQTLVLWCVCIAMGPCHSRCDGEASRYRCAQAIRRKGVHRITSTVPVDCFPSAFTVQGPMHAQNFIALIWILHPSQNKDSDRFSGPN